MFVASFTEWAAAPKYTVPTILGPESRSQRDVPRRRVRRLRGRAERNQPGLAPVPSRSRQHLALLQRARDRPRTLAVIHRPAPVNGGLNLAEGGGSSVMCSVRRLSWRTSGQDRLVVHGRSTLLLDGRTSVSY